MTRGDHVFIVRGDWEGKRGSVVFIDHLAGLVTISLDVGPTHMIKTPIQNVARVISNGDVV
jgi:ribosomal protein L24